MVLKRDKNGENLIFKIMSYHQNEAHKLSDARWKNSLVKERMPARARSARPNDPPRV